MLGAKPDSNSAAGRRGIGPAYGSHRRQPIYRGPSFRAAVDGRGKLGHLCFAVHAYITPARRITNRDPRGRFNASKHGPPDGRGDGPSSIASGKGSGSVPRPFLNNEYSNIRMADARKGSGRPSRSIFGDGPRPYQLFAQGRSDPQDRVGARTSCSIPKMTTHPRCDPDDSLRALVSARSKSSGWATAVKRRAPGHVRPTQTPNHGQALG